MRIAFTGPGGSGKTTGEKTMRIAAVKIIVNGEAARLTAADSGPDSRPCCDCDCGCEYRRGYADAIRDAMKAVDDCKFDESKMSRKDYAHVLDYTAEYVNASLDAAKQEIWELGQPKEQSCE